MVKGGYVRITEVKSITQVDGNYGPQMKITVKDESGKFVSGWIPLSKYNQADWQIGKTVDATVSQNGKYWNFKLNKKSEPQTSQVSSESDVLAGLREIYKLLKEIRDMLRKDRGIVADAMEVFDAFPEPGELG